MDRSNLPDQDLVEQLRVGKESAFEALFGRYQVRVYRLALSITKNVEDAGKDGGPENGPGEAGADCT